MPKSMPTLNASRAIHRGADGLSHARANFCGLLLWRPSESEGPRALLAERADQGHEFLRAFRIKLGVHLEVVKTDRRLQDHARREPCLVPARFRFVGPLWPIPALSLAREEVDLGDAGNEPRQTQYLGISRLRSPIISKCFRFLVASVRPSSNAVAAITASSVRSPADLACVFIR